MVSPKLNSVMGCASSKRKPEVEAEVEAEVVKDEAAGEIQTGAAAYLARKRAQQKAAEKEKEKDLAAAEIQTSSAALLANLRARKEAEEAADDEGEGEEGDTDPVPDSSRAYTRHGRAVQAKARMAKDAAQKKAAGETDASENPLVQLSHRLFGSESPTGSGGGALPGVVEGSG